MNTVDTTLTQLLQEVVDLHLQLARVRDEMKRKDARIAELEKPKEKE